MEESRAQRIVREMKADIYGPQNAAIAEGRRDQQELADLDPNTEMDFKELVHLHRYAGWRAGLLCARNVIMNEGDGVHVDQGAELSAPSKKVSARACSRYTGISDKTVKKYLVAWNLAAAAHLVPESNQLSPGQIYTFDEEVHTQDEWKKYFKPSAGEKEEDPIGKVQSFYKTITNFDLRKINADSCYDTETHVDDIEAWFIAIRAFGQAGLDRLDALTAEGVWTVRT